MVKRRFAQWIEALLYSHRVTTTPFLYICIPLLPSYLFLHMSWYIKTLSHQQHGQKMMVHVINFGLFYASNIWVMWRIHIVSVVIRRNPLTSRYSLPLGSYLLYDCTTIYMWCNMRYVPKKSKSSQYPICKSPGSSTSDNIVKTWQGAPFYQLFFIACKILWNFCVAHSSVLAMWSLFSSACAELCWDMITSQGITAGSIELLWAVSEMGRCSKCIKSV